MRLIFSGVEIFRPFFFRPFFSVRGFPGGFSVVFLFRFFFFSDYRPSRGGGEPGLVSRQGPETTITARELNENGMISVILAKKFQLQSQGVAQF